VASLSESAPGWHCSESEKPDRPRILPSVWGTVTAATGAGVDRNCGRIRSNAGAVTTQFDGDGTVRLLADIIATVTDAKGPLPL
jgi:hypothetical protein